tara:strand:+ start:1270 stop:1446 length:177 start_codon:yes stop_codon:yes gene_type:complete
MAITYKLMNDTITGGSATSVKKTDDDGNISFIPFDTGNYDYQEYLEWVAAGNTPDPAD